MLLPAPVHTCFEYWYMFVYMAIYTICTSVQWTVLRYWDRTTNYMPNSNAYMYITTKQTLIFPFELNYFPANTLQY